ncbi:uncharacterized protein [Mycetomoellerius zeteki]|uniref:uncharacterized protein isoform X2 n=1 Tax=Mycetomoellerius zeteki TaxID=64791 RepID=UPI00084E4210|nr:PREDICTED: uncharacterized protein LOC108720855 isoform X2 [Trachymyrmex zeteki]
MVLRAGFCESYRVAACSRLMCALLLDDVLCADRPIFLPWIIVAQMRAVCVWRERSVSGAVVVGKKPSCGCVMTIDFLYEDIRNKWNYTVRLSPLSKSLRTHPKSRVISKLWPQG